MSFLKCSPTFIYQSNRVKIAIVSRFSKRLTKHMNRIRVKPRRLIGQIRLIFKTNSRSYPTIHSLWSNWMQLEIHQSLKIGIERGYSKSGSRVYLWENCLYVNFWDVSIFYIVAILIEIIKTIILSVHFNCFHFCKNVIYAYCSARENGRKIDVKWLFHGFECNNKMYINLIVSIYDCVYIPVLWISVNEKKESKFSSMVIVKLLRHIQCEIGLIWTDKRTHTHTMHFLFIESTVSPFVIRCW